MPISEKTAMKIFMVSRTAYSVVVVKVASRWGWLDLDGDEQQASGDRGQAGRSGEFGGGDGHVRLLGPAARAAAAARWRYSSQSHSD